MTEHGRLIDADALIDKYGDWYTEEGSEEGFIGTIKSLVDTMPTIEPDQEKPAKWIIYEVANCDGEPPIAWECPECGEVVNCKYKFCPGCGKPMEVELW